MNAPAGSERPNRFGPDRDDKPGLTDVPGRMPPQLTDVMVESGAMRSKSRGLVPVVTIRMVTDDGTEFAGVIEVGPALLGVIDSLLVAGARARGDVKAAAR